MNDVFLLVLLTPVKRIRELLCKDSGKNLVTRIVKTGDFVNATSLLVYLQKSVSCPLLTVHTTAFPMNAQGK